MGSSRQLVIITPNSQGRAVMGAVVDDDKEVAEGCGTSRMEDKTGAVCI